MQSHLEFADSTTCWQALPSKHNKSAWRVVQHHSRMTSITQHNPWEVFVVLNYVLLMHSSHILRFIHSLLPVLQVVLRNIITGFILRRITKKEAMCIIQIDAIQPKWILIAHSNQRTNNSEQTKHALLSERMTESISMGGRVQNHNQKRQRLTSDFR